MKLTNSGKTWLIETAKALRGSERRVFMARTVKELGRGGQRMAEGELGWNRGTIRKGRHELESGVAYADNFSARGRKPVEVHLPNLLNDIRELVDSQSQVDPQFRTRRLYCRLSAGEVRRQLIAQKGYRDHELPTAQTINTKMNNLGYYAKKVAKSQPQKIPQTDDIFAQVNAVNRVADQAENVLRISMDAKARVNIGPFSRGGSSRVEVKASDHDFKPKAILTPVGIFLPQFDDLFIYMVTSRVTADCLVDCLQRWWDCVSQRFAQIDTLVINLDNGPENHSRRTQFMKRLLEFAKEYGLTICLAYYPPYHSKYNPVERCWGILENYWNGALLDSVEVVLRFAANMTYNGKHPLVELVTTTYKTGVKLSKNAMRLVEALIKRLPQLEKWFVDISLTSLPVWDV